MKHFAALIFVISFSAQAQAQDFSYNCFSYFSNGHENEKETLELVVSEDEAHAEMRNSHGQRIETVGGSRNAKYKSKGSVKYAKFGSTLIVEKALLTGGRVLRDGDLGGFARVEGEAEGGFYQYKFICKAL